MNMFKLEGKTALVTGAAKRLGRSIAVELAKQRANVIIHYDKSLTEAQTLQKQITDLGTRSWLLQMDLGDAGSCERLIEEAHRVSGSVNVLINNASVFSINDIKDVKIQDIDLSMLINAWAPFLLSRHFASQAETGKIINVLDTRITGYDFNHFAYYLSKKMLEVLTRSMALKLAPNVTVNGIAPGLILPPKNKGFSYLEEKKETVPLKKYGSPSDVTETVIFLLRSDYVTGQIIYVDGGQNLVQTLEGL